uniref:Phorbol-ester/DAG-type domain-containing protein n=1 Tax=Rhabditophanes sp. KR3021 TaxID=114890 RepID=A0AC35TRP2_9BILA
MTVMSDSVTVIRLCNEVLWQNHAYLGEEPINDLTDALDFIRKQNAIIKDLRSQLAKEKEDNQKLRECQNSSNNSPDYNDDSLVSEEDYERAAAKILVNSKEDTRRNSMTSILHSKSVLDEVPIKHHAFGAIKSLSSDTCDNCQKSFSFGKPKLRCSGCLLTIHEKCKNEVKDKPCFMRNGKNETKKSIKENSERKRLIFYCPNISTQSVNYCVPHLIQNCTHYLDKLTGENSQDLYNKNAMSGSEKTLSVHLLKAFHHRRVPDLTCFSPKCIAFTVMLFLSELSEPLIPASSWKEFYGASDGEEILKAIKELPLPNKHTMAMLILHWRNQIRKSQNPLWMRDSFCSNLWSIVLGHGRSSLSITTSDSTGRQVMKTLLTGIPSENFLKLLKEKAKPSNHFAPILKMNTKDQPQKKSPLLRYKTIGTPIIKSPWR